MFGVTYLILLELLILQILISMKEADLSLLSDHALQIFIQEIFKEGRGNYSELDS